jgi:hypothetical protein
MFTAYQAFALGGYNNLMNAFYQDAVFARLSGCPW